MGSKGCENENVFDIQKGVAISLFVKKPGVERGIWHADIWGSRLSKYQQCANGDIRRTAWAEPNCFSPYFMMSPIDWTGWDEYGQWWQLADSLNPAEDRRQIFPVNVLGFQTHRDHFAIAFERADMLTRVRDLCDVTISDSVLREKYSLRDNRDWGSCGKLEKLCRRQTSLKPR